MLNNQILKFIAFSALNFVKIVTFNSCPRDLFCEWFELDEVLPFYSSYNQGDNNINFFLSIIDTFTEKGLNLQSS